MISIIVPIYKAEKYLHRCIDSILAQTYQDWELLLIDDGSPDNSGAICDEYASKDSRIKVFHKPNGGVSSARNYGIDKASGDWICFIDADDYIKGDYLSCVENCKEDLIFNKSESFRPDTDFTQQEDEFNHMIISDVKELRHFLSFYSNTRKIRTPWAKIFRKDKIASLRFNEKMKIGEDTNFVFTFFLKYPSVKIANNGTYMYMESITGDLSKYGLNENTARYTLHQIFDVYDQLEAPNLMLENSMYSFFTYLCANKVDEIESWQSDQLIERLRGSSSQLHSAMNKLRRLMLKHRCAYFIDFRLAVCVFRYYIRLVQQSKIY